MNIKSIKVYNIIWLENLVEVLDKGLRAYCEISLQLPKIYASHAEFPVLSFLMFYAQ